MTQNRPSVPKNVDRSLWVESMGRCSNPDCRKVLIEDGVNIGDMAHIIEYAEGGEDTLDNMILLCKNCHKLVDGLRETTDVVSLLKEWKRENVRYLEGLYRERYSKFSDLKEKIVPLLEENRRIFDSYGPHSDAKHAYHFWKKYEGCIVVNNEWINRLVVENRRLFPRKNSGIIDRFLMHADEFKDTRSDEPIRRAVLFPADFLSIFGLEKYEGDIKDVNNLSALQNLINKLKRNCESVKLAMIPEPILTYIRGGKEYKIHLTNTPYVNQLYYSHWLFRTKTTDMPLVTFKFVLDRLHEKHIQVDLGDHSDLTLITIFKKRDRLVRVKLYYSYALSEADIRSSSVESGWILVNTHHWNRTPICDDAKEYAEVVGCKAMTQEEFFNYCDRL